MRNNGAVCAGVHYVDAVKDLHRDAMKTRAWLRLWYLCRSGPLRMALHKIASLSHLKCILASRQYIGELLHEKLDSQDVTDAASLQAATESSGAAMMCSKKS